MVHVSLADSTICGGELVAPTWVLTAGHCVSGVGAAPTPSQGVTLTFGRSDRTKTSEGLVLSPKRVVVHPAFDIARLQNDLALLELPSAVAYPVVGVANGSETALWGEGAIGTVYGWGATPTSGNAASEQLMVTAMQRIPHESKCDVQGSMVSVGGVGVPGVRQYEYDPEIHFCADGSGPGQGNACSGDSGGPFAVRTPRGALRVAGVVSYGPTGCNDDPTNFSVYTQVAGPKLLSWIASVAPEAIAPIEPPPAPVEAGAAGSAPQTQGRPATAPRKPSGKSKRKPTARAKRRRVCRKVKRRGRPAKRVCRTVRKAKRPNRRSRTRN